MSTPIQFELSWVGTEPLDERALAMTRRGDVLSLAPEQVGALSERQRGRLKLAYDLRGRFADALAAGLPSDDAALLVTLADWRAAWRGERPCPYTTVVYIEVPELTPLTEHDKIAAAYGPTIWSYASGRVDDLHAWGRWITDHGLQAGRFVFDVGKTDGEIPELTAVMGRALFDGCATHVAMRCATATAARVYGFLLSDLLASLDRRGAGIRVVSCPTCARCRVDMRAMVHEIQQRLPDTDVELEIAIMGCEVNGPGEAKSADVGIAIGSGIVTLFENGKITERFAAEEAVDGFLAAIQRRVASGERVEV